MIEVKPYVFIRCGADTLIDISSRTEFKGSEPLYTKSTIDALQARIAELEKDAGRIDDLHKNLEQYGGVHWLPDWVMGAGKTPPTREEFRATLDAAIAKENSNG